IGGAAPVLRPLDDQLQLFPHPRLPDELVERARTQAGVDIALPDGERRRHLTFGLALLGGVCVESAHFLPSMDSADRNAVDVLASGSSASTLSVASSACLAENPNPTRASTTGPRTAWPPAVAAPAAAPATGPTLSRSSSTMRSAPRLPLPCTRVTALSSPSARHCHQVCRECTRYRD